MSRAHTIHVATEVAYDVVIGVDVAYSLGRCLAKHLPKSRLRLVSDETVYGLYGQKTESLLKEAGYEVTADVVPPGETSKSVATWQKLMERWATDQVHRSDAAVALGGGVIGDLCGFCAASYARGIPFVQVPTTLLAAVDSSVGGKTALNLQAGKNLVGAVHQPTMVVCDTTFLSTSDAGSWQDGLAELLKMGVLADPTIVSRLLQGPLQADDENLSEWIGKAVAHKADFVAKDEKDTGLRQQLNLGHTIGHAIETLSDYRISHGHAVAMGLAAVVRISSAMGRLPSKDRTGSEQALHECGLPSDCPWSAEALLDVMARDKKADGSGITFVLPERIGSCVLQHVSYRDLKGFLKKGGL